MCILLVPSNWNFLASRSCNSRYARLITFIIITLQTWCNRSKIFMKIRSRYSTYSTCSRDSKHRFLTYAIVPIVVCVCMYVQYVITCCVYNVCIWARICVYVYYIIFYIIGFIFFVHLHTMHTYVILELLSKSLKYKMTLS